MTTFAGWRMLPVHTTYGGFYYSVAVPELIFGSLWAAYEQIGKSIRPGNLGAGALSVWTALMLATSMSTPSGSFALIWPLLFAALAIGYRARATEERTTTSLAILALVAIVPGIAMIVPGHSPRASEWNDFRSYCPGVRVAPFFGLFIPYIDFLTSGRRWIVPGVLGSLALAMIIKGNDASNFDASQPHPDSIFYFQDTDRGRARWVVWIRGPTLSPRNFSSITCAADGCRSLPGSRPGKRRTATSRRFRATLLISIADERSRATRR